MRKTVRRRHNKDGSITQTTSYSRKNIFGTRVVDTYTERVEQRPQTKLKKSNSIAIIILAIAVLVVPILGISFSWNADFLIGFVKFSIISFVLYMMINNILPLKRLVIKCWKKNRRATILGTAAFVGGIAIVSAIPTKNDSNRVDNNQNAISSTLAVTESEPTNIANENNDHNEYAADDLVNRFIAEFNDQSVYPMTNISQGNIRTKYHCSTNGCRVEIINATKAAAETFNVSIDGGTNDDGEEKMLNIFTDTVKIFDPSLTDEQINNAITEFVEGEKIVEKYSLSANISVTYIPSVDLSRGKSNRRIDIAAANYK